MFVQDIETSVGKSPQEKKTRDKDKGNQILLVNKLLPFAADGFAISHIHPVLDQYKIVMIYDFSKILFRKGLFTIYGY